MKNLKKYLIMIMLTSMGCSSCQFQGPIFNQQGQRVTPEQSQIGLVFPYKRDSESQLISDVMDTIPNEEIAKYEVYNRLTRMSPSGQTTWAVLVSLVAVPGMLEYVSGMNSPVPDNSGNTSFQKSGKGKNK